MKYNSVRRNNEAQNEEIFIKIILFILWPFFSFLYSLKTPNRRSSHIIFFLFGILFGWSMYFQGIGIDFHVIVERFYEQEQITFSELINIISSTLTFQSDNKDCYNIFLNWLTKIFSNNFHLLFTLAAIPYTYFLLKSLSFITSDKVKFKNSIYGLAIIILFVLPKDLFDIQNFRFGTAFWIAIYCILQIFYQNKFKYIILLLLVAVLPAITEEITIRGVVLSGYEDKNIYLSSMVTGLLFGIMHLDAQQFLYATILGFVLALVVRITNTIFASALIHFLINGTSITIQKIMSLTYNNNTIIQESTEISLKSMPMAYKLITAGIYGAIALAFGIVAFFIIKKLMKLNIKRGIIIKEEVGIGYSKSNEKVFNIQFISIIIIYLIFMIRIPLIINFIRAIL